MLAHSTKPIVVAFALTVVALLSPLPATGAMEEDNEVVSFRLTDWKAVHLHDAKAAGTLVVTLEKIGCEVQKHSHGDHIDVKYRCPEWKSIRLKSHDDAHQWEKWFKGKGFETHHEH